MEVKIIYMTNDKRRYAVMGETCRELQEKGALSDLCNVVQIERSSEWNYVWERKLQGSVLVVGRFINNVTKSAFWQDCRAFLTAHHIPYILDAVESVAGEEQGTEIAPAVVDRLRRYSFYGGAENFRNFWRYAASQFDPSLPEPDEPAVRAWAGIYHPALSEGYTTNLSLYREKFCRSDRPTLGLLFYRDEWIWDNLKYPAAFVK